nr:hypothetical protein Iba_chr12eCG7180 [Ipomoea batatas]
MPPRRSSRTAASASSVQATATLPLITVSDDLSGLLDQTDAYVAVEEDISNPNVEDSDDEYIDEIREPIADRTNVLKDLHVHGPGYTHSPPAIHFAATQDPRFEKCDFEFSEAEPTLIKVDHRLLTGAQVDDLVMPNDDVGPSSVAHSISLTIAFIENELSLIHDQWKILTAREALITSLLSTLQKDVHDRESPDCTVATSLESTSSFVSSDESVSF